MDQSVQKVQAAQESTAMGSIADSIESKIFTIRGKQVMIDRDLAVLYGVETRSLNQAVKRNCDRFPEYFMFQLTQEDCLVSQIVISNSRGGPRFLPYAFTEEGVAALSGVLRSKVAVSVNIRIMRAFVAMRHCLISNSGVLQRIESLESWKLKTTEQVDAILDRMQALEPKEKNEQLFQNGCVFDAWSYVSALIREAKTEIILIDNYVDETVLAILAKRGDGEDLGNTWGAMIEMKEIRKVDILKNLSN